MFRVLPEDDVNQVRKNISAYSVVTGYSMNQVRQKICRAINKKMAINFMNNESSSFESDSDSKQEMDLLALLL